MAKKKKFKQPVEEFEEKMVKWMSLPHFGKNESDVDYSKVNEVLINWWDDFLERNPDFKANFIEGISLIKK